ncbi:hypothetical protein [Sphingopyxis sp. DBS4]|uniref:hypothetical protein n=1 Tax=Sphingopyxis sp. DBS4 TaxID=2968500 RepID=UPI00214BE976|nr:hypothetical protein [Sphingopyxis sp. DBS4]
MMGIILAVIGAVLMAIGFFQSGAPTYSDTLNIGLLNDKSNLIAVGGYLFVGGMVLHAKEAILAVLAPAPSAPEKAEWSPSDGITVKGDDGAVV